jgi:hypothetical protein
MLLRERLRSAEPEPEISFNEALDSGAFTLFTKYFVERPDKTYKNGARATPSLRSDPKKVEEFYQSPRFMKYMLEYMNFLHVHGDMFDFYVTVDVLNNVRLTKLALEMMLGEGLRPMPVYHYGEPFSVFKEYADKHEYVALGGNSPADAHSLAAFASPVFKYLCGPAMKFAPSVKIHALGMTSVPFMAHFPIYSFDSTSWAYQARTGAILLPRLDHFGKPRWLDRWFNIPMTERTRKARNHWLHTSSTVRHHAEEYFELHGFTRSQLAESYTARDRFNMFYWFSVQRELNAHYRDRWGYDGGRVYLSGNPTTGGDEPHVYCETMMKAARRANIRDINYLATFWYKNDLRELMAVKNWWDIKLEKRSRQ